MMSRDKQFHEGTGIILTTWLQLRPHQSRLFNKQTTVFALLYPDYTTRYRSSDLTAIHLTIFNRDIPYVAYRNGVVRAARLQAV